MAPTSAPASTGSGLCACRFAQGNFERPKALGRLPGHAAHPHAARHLAFHPEQGHLGGKGAGRIEQRRSHPLQVRRPPDPAHGLVQLAGCVAAGAVARFRHPRVTKSFHFVQ